VAVGRINLFCGREGATDSTGSVVDVAERIGASCIIVPGASIELNVQVDAMPILQMYIHASFVYVVRCGSGI
jgi:uncharacterized UPF0146 family protein